jgi:hypothetical protein
VTTFYLDYEGGSDAADGLSFANRWKTFTSGATAARIAPGDTVRVMASPDPTSLGITGAWTDGPLQATQAMVSSTNATPIVITHASPQLAVGDTIIVNAHLTNTKANGVWEVGAIGGSTGAWTASLLAADASNSVGNGAGGATGTVRKINNCRVLLASAVTQNIACNGNQGTKTNWTASASVTATVVTSDFKEGGECQQIDVAAGFTTGLAAYFPTGTLNLAGYQQLSFRIKQTAGTVGAASSLTLRLCSDAAGVTTVDTFNIPSQVALSTWAVFTVNKGSALGASIASIAFDVNTDNGAQTFLLDNVIAVKAVSAADSLNLNSLIGKNTTDETWCAIQSINGKRVMLDGGQASTPTVGTGISRGYMGTTEAVTTYIRRPLPNITSSMALQDSGTVGAVITYSGGWNTTDMSTQTGETWFDGVAGNPPGFSAPFKNYLKVDNFHFVRYTYVFDFSTAHALEVANCSINNCSFSFQSGCNFSTTDELNVHFKSLCNNNVSNLLDFNRSSFGNTGVSISKCQSNSNALNVGGNNGTFSLCAISNSGTTAVAVSANAVNIVVKNLVTASNLTGGIDHLAGGHTLSLVNAIINDTTESSQSPSASSPLWSKNHDNTAGNHIGFIGGGLFTAQTTTRHTASGVAWKIDVTSTNRSASYPLNLEIAKIAVKANSLVTVSAWLRRTNTGLTHSLMCKGGQIAGVAANVATAMTAAADTWEQVTITFTPTEAGVVAITTESYGGTTFSGYVDDLSVSQA